MKKPIGIFALIVLFMITQFLTGCGTVKSNISSQPRLYCDKDADEASMNNNYEKSIILHEFFIKKNPENGLAMYHLGYCHGQLGDYENEVKYYKEAIRLGYYESGVFLNLGMAYAEMQRYDDAVRELKKAIKLDPNDTDIIYSLGMIYIEVGQKEEAFNQLEKLIKIAPEDEMTLELQGALEAESVDDTGN